MSNPAAIAWMLTIGSEPRITHAIAQEIRAMNDKAPEFLDTALPAAVRACKAMHEPELVYREYVALLPNWYQGAALEDAKQRLWTELGYTEDPDTA